MGLAPYGDFTKCRGVLDSFYPKYAAGDLVEPHSFGPGYYWNETGSMEFHFNEAEEIRALVQKRGPENIALKRSVLEEQVMEVIFLWMEREKATALFAAGGVFQECVSRSFAPDVSHLVVQEGIMGTQRTIQRRAQGKRSGKTPRRHRSSQLQQMNRHAAGASCG